MLACTVSVGSVRMGGCSGQAFVMRGGLHKPSHSKGPPQHRGLDRQHCGICVIEAASNVPGASLLLELAPAKLAPSMPRTPAQPLLLFAFSSAQGQLCRSSQQLILRVDVLLQEHSVRTTHILLKPTAIGSYPDQLALRTRARVEAHRDTLRPATVLG
jgi:hypothetical protein